MAMRSGNGGWCSRVAAGLIALAAAGVIGVGGEAEACSRVLWNHAGRGVYVGRNMDWFEDLRSNMWVLPRGMARDGATPVNPLRWTSRYGSFVITAYDGASCDGVNERGLAGHVLYLPETTVGPRDAARPGLSVSMWMQHLLDTCATVAEVAEVSRSEPFQLRMAVHEGSGKAGTIHLAFEDPTGDSVVLECIDGRVRVYHDRAHTVMTNQPTFDKQLENLRRYRGFGGQERLPGTHEPSDRFVRAAYYAKNLPTPGSEREAVAAVMSVMRNVSAPFGTSDPDRPNVSTTIWRTVYSLGTGVVYYDSVVSPNVFWVNTRELDYSPGAGVRRLTLVGNFDLHGDVTAKFEKAEMFTAMPAPE